MLNYPRGFLTSNRLLPKQILDSWIDHEYLWWWVDTKPQNEAT